MTENCKFHRAIISAFYNISQRNFGILLILWCSFKLWWYFCLDLSRSSHKGKGPLYKQFLPSVSFPFYEVLSMKIRYSTNLQNGLNQNSRFADAWNWTSGQCLRIKFTNFLSLCGSVSLLGNRCMGIPSSCSEMRRKNSPVYNSDIRSMRRNILFIPYTCNFYMLLCFTIYSGK
jgi:hypothetical protein